MYYSLEDPDFVGDDNPLFQQFRAHGESTGCRVAVTSLSRDGSADPEAGAILWVTFPPGFIVTRHCHNTRRVEIIIKGTVSADGREFGPGDVMISYPNEWYGPYHIGPEGAITAEIGGHLKDLPPITEGGGDLFADARAANAQ